MNLLKSKLSIFLITTVILAAIIYFGVNPLLKSFIKDQIEDKLIGNFSYTYENIEVDVLTGSAVLQKIKWQFPKDSSQLKHKGSLEEFSVEGIGIQGIFGKLAIDKIALKSPQIETKIEVNQLLNQKEDTTRLEQFNFYELIKGKLKSVSIHDLEITDASAKWYSPDFSYVWREVENGYLEAREILIDSTTTAQRNGMFGLESFQVGFDNALLNLADSLHSITLGKTTISSSDQRINIDSIAITPLIPQDKLYPHFKYEKTALHINVSHIELYDFDFKELFFNQHIKINKIKLSDTNLIAYKDKNAEFPYFKYPTLPQKLLQNLSKQVNIDTIEVKSAYIKYIQKAEKSNLKGEVFFSDLNAYIYNITNDTTQIAKNKLAHMKFKTSLYNKALLSGDIYFDLSSKKGNHTVKGMLDSISVSEANKMITPLLAFQIKSGRSNKITFDFNADTEMANGSLKFLYSDLKLKKLDRDNMKGNELDEQLISFIANGFVLKNANPDWLGKERKGNIAFKRNEHRSIFHYWWNAILSGIKSIVIPD